MSKRAFQLWIRQKVNKLRARADERAEAEFDAAVVAEADRLGLTDDELIRLARGPAVEPELVERNGETLACWRLAVGDWIEVPAFYDDLSLDWIAGVVLVKRLVPVMVAWFNNEYGDQSRARFMPLARCVTACNKALAISSADRAQAEEVLARMPAELVRRHTEIGLFDWREWHENDTASA